MDKEKLIELLKDAWNDGMSQYHDCKHHSQYKTDLENWLDANEDEINELCVSENTSDESAALHLHDVMPRLFAVCYKDAQMVAIHKTESGANENCKEWNKSDDIYYVMPVRIHS